MQIILINICLIFFTLDSFSKEVKIIELHNKSIEQIITESQQSSDEVFEDKDIVNEEQINIELDNENKESLKEEEDISILSETVSELPNLWEQINKEDANYLLSNINDIHSKKLKSELLSSLSLNYNSPTNYEKFNFEKLIIDNLLKLGNRKKAYDIIKTFQIDEDNKFNVFYNKLKINYLLSTYNLSKACELRNQTKELNLDSADNFFLKIDIFCLALLEKFDEANLLNSLLTDSSEKDSYFQNLFEKLQNNTSQIIFDSKAINEENVFLYSAMHRIGDFPLNQKFLEIDPVNLSMPIILSSNTDIELRIKAAHYAYFNKIINEDSVSALYQTVDFSYEQLNNPTVFINSQDNNIDLGMAFYYQLINVQLLPITRIEAIIQFWNFAKKNNLEKIAYALSMKNLNALDPAEEYSSHGPQIAKAYIYSDNLQMAEKWLVFSENFINDKDKFFIKQLNSTKLLYNLSNFNEKNLLVDILFNEISTFKNMNANFHNLETNEILFLIFESFEKNNLSNFLIDKKIEEQRKMPALYLLNLIRSSAKNNNEIRLLLSVLVSMNEKKWNELHPEHLRLLLIVLKQYKDGALFNDVLLEILKDNQII